MSDIAHILLLSIPRRRKRYYLSLFAWNLAVYGMEWLLYLSLRNLAEGKPLLLSAIPIVSTVSWVVSSLSALVPMIYKKKRAVRFDNGVQAICLRTPFLIMLMAVAR